MDTLLQESFFETVSTIDWFSQVGQSLGPGPGTIALVQAADEAVALASFTSDAWADAKTEAQGALTAWLSRHARNDYGSRWNPLAKEASARLETLVTPSLQACVATQGWPSAMVQSVLVDLTRAALEVSYRTRRRAAPVFFEHLLACYVAGHLPCGWVGELDAWPAGRLLVH